MVKKKILFKVRKIFTLIVTEMLMYFLPDSLFEEYF